jgi:hypothetical protein
MTRGDGDLWEDGRIGTPGLAGAPGIIEATIVAEEPAKPDVIDVVEVPEVRDLPDVAGLRTTPDVPHVPLWGPPSRGGAAAPWEQAGPADRDGTSAMEPGRPASTPVEPAPLGPPVRERRYRRTALVGVTLAGAVLLLGVVAVAAWPSTEATRSVANQSSPNVPGATGPDGAPAELPPSQPATPVSFAVSGDVVQPEPRRARIVDPRSGQDVVVDLPPGTRVDAATGQVVVRITGTPTSIRPSTTYSTTTTTTDPGSTSSTTEDTTSTTEDTTTSSTDEDPTTSETYPPIP